MQLYCIMSLFCGVKSFLWIKTVHFLPRCISANHPKHRETLYTKKTNFIMCELYYIMLLDIIIIIPTRILRRSL